MDDNQNVLVLAVFAGSLVAVIAGYLLAWRSNRTGPQRAGLLVVAAVSGFAGLIISLKLIADVGPLPPPDGEPVWEPVVFLLTFLPIPLGAFYICAKFVRRAWQIEPNFLRASDQRK